MFYMFREFSNNLRPSRVYLKIDFNHAGIGKSIPLITSPMKKLCRRFFLLEKKQKNKILASKNWDKICKKEWKDQ